MSNASTYRRSHHCSQLRETDVGSSVTIAGWVHSYRDHGYLLFIDLRDSHGMTQLVFDSETDAQMHADAKALRGEFVISVSGTVEARSEENINPKLPTGHVEVRVSELTLLSEAVTPPIEVDDRVQASEELRLKYRYLDLRRPKMQSILKRRHRVAKLVRDFMDSEGFLEVETPMLTRSTPEGARDFLVPSRINQGQFYALPQSPQLFKQILMCSGVERYFQIVRCFRDEDPRADRQAEFTQIDVEMSFVQMQDVMDVVDRLLAQIWKNVLDVEIPTPVPRMSYQQAIDEYGVDRPDLRFEMKLVELTELAKQSDFRVFTGAELVKGLCVTDGSDKFSRNDVEKTLTEYVKGYGAKGLAYFRHTDGKLQSTITKFFSEELLQKIAKHMGAKDGDLLVFVADEASTVNKALGALRVHLGEQMGLADPDEYRFVWIIDFPTVEWNEDENRWDSLHHPFTAPYDEDLDKIDSEPGSMRSKAYDIVVNGNELAGGSIRIHRSDIQEKIFALLGIDADAAKERFGFFLNALKHGTPPHGGIAFGLDRILMLLSKTDNIRDVIAFPKTQRGACLLTDAPAPVDDKQLADLAIRTVASKGTRMSQ